MLVQVARLALCLSHIGSVTLTLSLLPRARSGGVLRAAQIGDPDAPRSRGGCSSAALTSIGQVGPSPIGSRYTASTSAASTSRFERAHFVDQEQRARAARFSAALYLHPVADDRLAQRIGREVRELACQPAHEAFPRRSGPRSRRNKSGSRAQQGGRCCYNLE
jgi:hypothetical protein